MNVYTCNDHDAVWPVGCASVVIAETEKEARELLDKALVDDGLAPHKKHPYSLDEVRLDIPSATILCGERRLLID
jgi:hypothetical protein